MVTQSDLVTARAEIEKGLKEFVRGEDGEKVQVFESEWGHIRARVASDAFKNVSVVQRQELIWDWLREHVATEFLVWLYGVHAMDHAEYDAMMNTE